MTHSDGRYFKSGHILGIGIICYIYIAFGEHIISLEGGRYLRASGSALYGKITFERQRGVAGKCRYRRHSLDERDIVSLPGRHRLRVSPAFVGRHIIQCQAEFSWDALIYTTWHASAGATPRHRPSLRFSDLKLVKHILFVASIELDAFRRAAPPARVYSAWWLLGRAMRYRWQAIYRHA